MALLRQGGIDPLYSGAQITHRGADVSNASRGAMAVGNPLAAWVLGVNSGRSSVVRSRSSLCWPRLLALVWKRWANLRFSPLLAVMINRSSVFSELMSRLSTFEVELCLTSH